MSTILLVDDQNLFRENLAEALQDHGFDVIQAIDGTQALANCEAVVPDLVLLDIALPGMNGMEVLRHMRARQVMRQVPTLFLTAFPREEYLEEANLLGVGDFLVKSDISLRDLLARIEDRLAPPNTPGSSLPTRFQADDEGSQAGSLPHLRPAMRRWKPTTPHPAQVRYFALTVSPVAALNDVVHMVNLESSLRKLVLTAAVTGPFQGQPAPTSTSEAVQRLSIPTVMRLVGIRTVLDLAGKGIPPIGDLTRLWKHCVLAGLLCESMATPDCFPSHASAFLAGLCGEISSVFSILALEEQYVEVRAGAWEDELLIQRTMAEMFETTPAHLGLECLRSMEVPDCISRAVLDRLSGLSPISLWEPTKAGALIDTSLLLSAGMGQIWNPCVPIRHIHVQEMDWNPNFSRLEELLPQIEHVFESILNWKELFPEFSQGSTRAMEQQPRKIRYFRDRWIFTPDPVEGILRTMGDVVLVNDPTDLFKDDESLRVAGLCQGSPTWARLLEQPRRTLLLYTGPARKDLRLGAHAELLLPAPITQIERSLRPR